MSCARVVFCLGLCAGMLSAAPAARAAEPLKLLIWINGDKGYNGLQKVGDAFAAEPTDAFTIARGASAFLGALAVPLTAIAGARLFDDRRVGVDRHRPSGDLPVRRRRRHFRRTTRCT